MPTHRIKTRDCQFRVKAADDGIIEGLASTFGNRDLDDETVRFGAFAKTLQETGGRVPILDSHNRMEPIGWNIEARESQRGLEVRGELDIENNMRAKSKFSFVRKGLEIGAKAGLSIGFRPIKIERDNENDLTIFTEVKLLEYSIVTFPANPEAMVTGAKSEVALPFLDLPIKEYGFSLSDEAMQEAAQKHQSPDDFCSQAYLCCNDETGEYKYQIAGVTSGGELVAVPKMIRDAAEQAQKDGAPYEVLKHLEKYLGKIGADIPWRESQSVELIRTYKQAISLHEKLLDNGHEFSDEEIMALSEIGTMMEELTPIEKDEVNDLINNIQKLTNQMTYN